MTSPTVADLICFGRDIERPEVVPVEGGQVCVYSRAAPSHAGNEDAALVQSVPGVGVVLAVADGAGGYDDGAWAARTAIEQLRDSVATASPGELRSAIVDGVERASETIRSRSGTAATTLVLAEICDNHVRPIHVGDSALLVTSSRGRIKLQTVAHSPTGYAVEAGLLSEDEALRHAERHLVCNLLGDEATSIEVGLPTPLAPQDTVLLASDGLFDNLAVEKIVAIIRKGPLPRAARALAAACQSQMRSEEPSVPAKPDDLTFVLYRPRPATKA